MTSRLDEDALHPLVSSLLAGSPLPSVPSTIKAYNREEMMKLRGNKLSMTRPDYLSEDFNGDDGKFSPLKWLEHRWEVEGIKNRPSSKKIDLLCAGADDNTGLSPQRRAFSSGCRAPADDKRDGHEKDERLGGHGKNWRNGSNGGSDKFASKGNDFKLPFQKGGFGAGTRNDWKRNEKDVRPSKFGQRRDERAGSISGSERLPEWADGPTTMDDMIELRGFEEPKKGKKKNAKEVKKGASKPSEITPEMICGSRPSSTGLMNNKGNIEMIEDSAIESAEIAHNQQGALPATDHELAALLGLDINVTHAMRNQSDEHLPASGSRLSRFFTANTGKKSKSPDHDPHNDENMANPVLGKLFGHQAQQHPGHHQVAVSSSNAGADQPGISQNGLAALGLTNVKAGLRLEDLEKSLPSNERKQSGQGKSIQDPSQHAELLQSLHKIAKQQSSDGPRQPSPPNVGGAQQQQGLPHGFGMPAEPALLASFAQNPLILNAYVENQLQEAVAASIRANHGQPIPPQLHEQLRLASIRNKMFLQQQTVAFAHFTAQQHHQQQQHHHIQQQQQQNKNRGPAPQMIPASVQRQLQKTSGHAEKKDKSVSPPEHTDPQQHGIDGQTDLAGQLKKMQMHQNYNQMMNAMNSGLGMQGWRQNQPMPPNVQMLLAAQQQAQAQAQMKMMIGRQQQQQMLMAKLLQMQQAQQQHQQHQSHHHQMMHAPGHERGHIQHPQVPAVPSELSQVGPIQTPLEKLLASVGVQASQFTGSAPSENRLPTSARPLNLEDLEKELTAQQQ